MKIKMTIMILLIAFSMSSVASATEVIGPVATDTGEENQTYFIDSVLDELFDDALSREGIFSNLSTPQTYKVKTGDNLYRIALKYNVSLNTLMEWNDLSDYTIRSGEELIVSNGNEVNGGTKRNIPEPKAIVASTTPIAPSSSKKVEEGNNQPTVTLGSGEEPEGREIMVTATAYTAYCPGCSGTTAYGIDLRANPNEKVIAVDPNVIPLGTKVWVEGYGEAIAGDTGGAIKGHKIDVFIPSYDQALQWGRKQVKLKILN
ncbi:3D domain-containing protein [Ureibacillus sp. NPDC094379]